MNLLVIITVLAALNIDVAFSRKKSKKRWWPEPWSNNNEKCRSGDGSSYRGSESKSGFGRPCVNWNKIQNQWGAGKGLGNHNYCRNPDQSLMPWCHVRRGRRVVREFCYIPKCSTVTLKPPQTADTEMTCGERSEQRQNKIVGGSFTTIESQPWVAAIFQQRTGFLCGGSLIAPCWVVTAAHCFADGDSTNINRLSVHLGKSAINETDATTEQSFTVEKLIIHQQFNESTFDHDIALLKIRGRSGGCAVRSASARAVCLLPYHTQLPTGIQCSIAGFGLERYLAWHYSQYLKQAEVKLINRAQCSSQSHYGDLITKNMFCAGSPYWSTDACKGDSGGPLVCEVSGRMFLYGVVSWGDGCAKQNKPGVYTQVTNYNKWIADTAGLQKFTNGVMFPQK